MMILFKDTFIAQGLPLYNQGFIINGSKYTLGGLDYKLDERDILIKQQYWIDGKLLSDIKNDQELEKYLKLLSFA